MLFIKALIKTFISMCKASVNVLRMLISIIILMIVKLELAPIRIQHALHIRKLKKQLDKLTKGTSHVQ